jgi:hypothetical protein
LEINTAACNSRNRKWLRAITPKYLVTLDAAVSREQNREKGTQEESVDLYSPLLDPKDAVYGL